LSHRFTDDFMIVGETLVPFYPVPLSIAY